MIYIYRICLAIGGTVIHDNNSYILYRQHKNNVVGITNSILKKMKAYEKFNRTRRIAANNILNLYNNYISEENKKIIKKIADFDDSLSFFNKISYLIDSNYKSYKLKSDFKFIFDILMGKL